MFRMEHNIFELLKQKEIDLSHLNILLNKDVRTLNLNTLDIIDKNILNELKSFDTSHQGVLYIGTTVSDIKCILKDDNYREHEIIVKYKAPKKLTLVSVNLPYSQLQDKEFQTLMEIVTHFRKYLNDLSSYFYELDKIDQLCSVMEPVNPSYKDDYRRILLDDRTWLHIEVTMEGLATNIHLVGQTDDWQNKLQSGLLSWDHDNSIVENIMTVFNLSEFPVPSFKSLNTSIENIIKEAPTCGICLCDELPDNAGLPLPLCQNITCGVYYHRTCLYQWLVACSGSRPPAFGVATGACPTCLQPIACSEKDS